MTLKTTKVHVGHIGKSHNVEGADTHNSRETDKPRAMPRAGVGGVSGNVEGWSVGDTQG